MQCACACTGLLLVPVQTVFIQFIHSWINSCVPACVCVVEEPTTLFIFRIINYLFHFLNRTIHTRIYRIGHASHLALHSTPNHNVRCHANPWYRWCTANTFTPIMCMNFIPLNGVISNGRSLRRSGLNCAKKNACACQNEYFSQLIGKKHVINYAGSVDCVAGSVVIGSWVQIYPWPWLVHSFTARVMFR